MDWNDMMHQAAIEDEENDRLIGYQRHYRHFLDRLSPRELESWLMQTMRYRQAIEATRITAYGVLGVTQDPDIDAWFAQILTRLFGYEDMLRSAACAASKSVPQEDEEDEDEEDDPDPDGEDTF